MASAGTGRHFGSLWAQTATPSAGAAAAAASNFGQWDVQAPLSLNQTFNLGVGQDPGPVAQSGFAKGLAGQVQHMMHSLLPTANVPAVAGAKG